MQFSHGDIFSFRIMFSLLFYSSIFLCEIVIQFMYIFMQDNFQFHNILSFRILKYPLILIFLLSTVLVCQVYRHQPVGLLGLAAFGNDLPPDFPPQTEVLFDLNVSPIESNLGLHWCPGAQFTPKCNIFHIFIWRNTWSKKFVFFLTISK